MAKKKKAKRVTKGKKKAVPARGGKVKTKRAAAKKPVRQVKAKTKAKTKAKISRPKSAPKAVVKRASAPRPMVAPGPAVAPIAPRASTFPTPG